MFLLSEDDHKVLSSFDSAGFRPHACDSPSISRAYV